MAVFIGATSGIKKISKLKKGEYFRKVGGNNTFIYLGKDRAYNTWGKFLGWEFVWQYYDDINRFGKSRKDIDVDTDW